MLRYPYEAITEKTDYLQLTIFSYDTAGNGTGNLLADKNFTNQNPFSSLSIARSVDKKKVLGNNGVIALPMPSNIEDSNSVSFEAGELNTFAKAAYEATKTSMGLDLGGVLTGGGYTKSEVDTMKNQLDILGSDEARKYLIGNLAVNAVNLFGANVSMSSLLARSEGKILNPNMELLFNNVTLRTFRFSFKMTPRDENESVSIKSIIRSLKKNMAAKGVDGIFLNTPNVFELQYKKGNRPHPFLNLFKPCALTDMSVNYTGENVYATYSDGTPISMVMTLTFKELVPIYAEDYDKYMFDGKEFNFTDDTLVYGTTGEAPNKIQRDDVQGVGY